MALKINREIETINKGVVVAPYFRIQSYHIDKPMGFMVVSGALYVSKEEADQSKFVYHEDITEPLNRPYMPGPIATSITMDGNSLEYPTLFDIPLSVSETITEDVYETQNLVRTVKYFDFDENGEIVEKTREEPYTDRVKTGTRETVKSRIDLSVIGSNPYEWAYSQIKPILEGVFGEGNVIDF